MRNYVNQPYKDSTFGETLGGSNSIYLVLVTFVGIMTELVRVTNDHIEVG